MLRCRCENGHWMAEMAEKTLDELEKMIGNKALKTLRQTLEKYEKIYAADEKNLDTYTGEDKKGFYITPYGNGYIHLTMFEPKGNNPQHDIAQILYRPDKTKETEVFYADSVICRRIAYLADGKTVDYELWKECLSGIPYKGTYTERRTDGTLRKKETYHGNTCTVERFSEDGVTRISQTSYKNDTRYTLQDGWEYKFDSQNNIIESTHYTNGVEDTKTFKRKQSLLKKIAKARVDSEKEGEISLKIKKKNTINLALAYIKAKAKEIADK